MMKGNEKSGFRTKIFFWTFLLLMLIINFIGGFFGLKHLYWHLFLHGGIIFFSFFTIIYSLILNEKAIKYIIFGAVLWIVTNAVLFLGHIFEEYSWLEINLFPFLGMIVGCLLLMRGFREAVRNE